VASCLTTLEAFKESELIRSIMTTLGTFPKLCNEKVLTAIYLLELTKGKDQSRY